MAIYSCNLKSIGRTTHSAGTAGAHIRYISRPEASPVILTAHMPDERRAARTWMDGREREMRKNARVVDKIRIALPRELTETQRAELVAVFMADLTGGRVPWFAAIHQRGEDAHNPHAHIAVHDRDIETGLRVLRLSDSARDRRAAGLPGPKAVEWIRERWETVCNEALAKAGHAARIDRRTLEAQGAGRMPTVHEGPRAQHIEGNVKRPESRVRKNGAGRVIDYPAIDQGRTRREFNAHVIDINLERAARSANPATALWAQFEKEQLARDRALEERLAEERRQRTAAQRAQAASLKAVKERLRKEKRAALRAAVGGVRAIYDPRREHMRRAQETERKTLQSRQRRAHVRLLALLDLTGTTKRRLEEARKALSGKQRAARKELTERYRIARSHAETAVKARYEAAVKEESAAQLRRLAALKAGEIEAERLADEARQRREAEREELREITQRKVEAAQLREKSGQQKVIPSSLAQAIEKAARREAGRGKDPNRDRDSEREM